jgi:hypothetical protein
MTTHLKQLKFTAVPSGSNPIMDQRMKLVRRLEDQKKLAADPNHVRVTRRWTGKGDARRQVEKTQRVSPWWKELPDGSVIMTLRVGFSAVEVEKGKAGIVVPSRDKVPDVIETLVAAVRAGELDQVIAAQAQTKSTKKHHRAV